MTAVKAQQALACIWRANPTLDIMSTIGIMVLVMTIFTVFLMLGDATEQRFTVKTHVSQATLITQTLKFINIARLFGRIRIEFTIRIVLPGTDFIHQRVDTLKTQVVTHAVGGLTSE